MAVGPTGTVYVADTDNQRVQVFNSSGVYQSTIGTTDSYGSGNNQFSYPEGVAVGPTGTVYVADINNQRVQVFNSSGNYQSTIGTTDMSGSGSNQFDNPYGAAVGPTSTLYIADSGNSRIVQFEISLPGDFNRDGQVTVADIAAMMAALANLGGYQSANGLSDQQLLEIADVNGDGVIDNTRPSSR